METQKNVFYNVMLAISQVLFPLITFPYLVRVLGPSEVGLLNFAESIARYFMLLAALGIPVYGIREIAKHQKDILKRSQVFTEIFLINGSSYTPPHYVSVDCRTYLENLTISASNASGTTPLISL